MSKQHSPESVGSYVTGFILSVICTAIPYFLVVNKTVAGNSLVVTILGFAILQVLIQTFFFLHLGRGPKPLYNLAFFGATVVTILVVVGGSLFIMNNLHYNMVPPSETVKQLAEGEAIAQVGGTKTGACESIKANHQIVIAKNMGTASPDSTKAQLCDTLSFINEDSMTREISFGTSTKAQTYDGQTTITVRKGKSETITLNQTGTYTLVDSHHPGSTLTLTITSR